MHNSITEVNTRCKWLILEPGARIYMSLSFPIEGNERNVLKKQAVFLNVQWLQNGYVLPVTHLLQKPCLPCNFVYFSDIPRRLDAKYTKAVTIYVLHLSQPSEDFLGVKITAIAKHHFPSISFSLMG